MRLSREKTVRLSHRIIDFLVASPDVDFIEDRDTIRQEIVTIITSLLKLEEQVDTEVVHGARDRVMHVWLFEPHFAEL